LRSRIQGLVLLALAFASVAAAAAPAPRSTPRATPAAAARGRARPLPDSILAEVGSHRRISVADFRRAWAQVEPPARSDSLTPQSAQEFLRLLVGKEALAEAALREAWAWTHPESAKFNALRDRLTLQAALEGPLAEARADLERAGTRDADGSLAGRVARDSAVARMHPVFDDAALERLARAFDALPRPSRDSGIIAQLRVLARNPQVEPRDSLAVLARTSEGDFRVCDLLDWWKTLNPLARPRVGTTEQVRDLVRNGVFERKLRAVAATLDLEHSAEIAAALDREREFLAVTHLVGREVYDSLEADSLTLRRFYDRNPDEYTIPARARCLRLEFPTRADAGRMAVRLRDRAEAESLAAKAGRQGLRYTVDLGAAGDSALFAEALRAGPDAVIGPDSADGSWRVARVIALLPPEPRSFEQARTLVEHAWYSAEGERRMVDLVERVRRKSRVVVNQRALARLTAS
jgi:hypothetical protein